MIQLEEAVAQILSRIPEPVTESVPLAKAHGRIAGRPIKAPFELPVFDNSSMDGYAVRADDIASASPEHPVRLRVTGRIPAGGSSTGVVEAGTAIRVFTGSSLPQGATAVVMQESTRTEPGRASEIAVLETVKPWENVRFKGEDVKLGSPIVTSGAVLTAGRIGLLAAMGIGDVCVAKRPRVGLIATGSELKESGERLGEGQIYESNRVAIAALCSGAGAEAHLQPIVPDDLKLTTAALERAFEQSDLVVTCGGVSVGETDFVKAAFEQLGGKLEFWKVQIKPGRPFAFGHWKKKLLFGLPGNPVSALVTFLLLVRPALRKFQGATDVQLPSGLAELGEDLANPGNRRHFIRVKTDASGKIFKSGTQASHVLSSTAGAIGLVDVPANTTLPAGTLCRLLRWD